jgi:hypothetical protein
VGCRRTKSVAVTCPENVNWVGLGLEESTFTIDICRGRAKNLQYLLILKIEAVLYITITNITVNKVGHLGEAEKQYAKIH